MSDIKIIIQVGVRGISLILGVLLVIYSIVGDLSTLGGAIIIGIGMILIGYGFIGKELFT